MRYCGDPAWAKSVRKSIYGRDLCDVLAAFGEICYMWNGVGKVRRSVCRKRTQSIVRRRVSVALLLRLLSRSNRCNCSARLFAAVQVIHTGCVPSAVTAPCNYGSPFPLISLVTLLSRTRTHPFFLGKRSPQARLFIK